MVTKSIAALLLSHVCVAVGYVTEIELVFSVNGYVPMHQSDSLAHGFCFS